MQGQQAQAQATSIMHRRQAKKKPAHREGCAVAYFILTFRCAWYEMTIFFYKVIIQSFL